MKKSGLKAGLTDGTKVCFSGSHLVTTREKLLDKENWIPDREEDSHHLTMTFHV